MLGVGIGLLVAGKLTEENRRLVGGTLLAIGAVSTIPLAWQVFGQPHRHDVVSANHTPLTDGELAM
jgi:hypothetical protein